MNSQTDTTEIILEEFDSAALPSLEDLMQELEAADDTAFEEQAVGGIRVVSEKSNEPFLETQPERRQEDSVIKRENEELIAALRRVQSDFENYRRRVERERGEHYAFAVSSIVKEILPVLDNFRLALSNSENHTSENDLRQFFDGYRLILQQLEKVLTVLGVQPIPAIGETFNPQYNEAIATEAAENIEPNTIIEEVVRGYRLGEKLIRSAMIKFSINAQ